MDGTGEMKYKVIFVLGPPGAGKNTQCDNLIKKFGLIHFGAGDLLRAESKKESEEGELIRNIMKEGKIVPTKITCGLIKKTMDSYGRDKKFLIDGYPRNKENWDGFKEVFGTQFEILATLYLHCEEDICVSRLLSRGQSSGRIDDESAVIKKRFNTFYNESLSVLDELKNEGKFIQVDSTRTPEEVEKEVSNQIGNILNL